MGWLRDSMRQTRSPHRSFGAVARAAVAHANWPKDSKAQPRSLASLLSKLDRGMEMQWLADRPAVQQVLAEVLGTPQAKIAEIAGAVLQQSEDFRRRLRLDDLPYASALDLAQEPLPPGIPEVILRPGSWRHLWWVAPSGSGRSLAGAWLAARGLAAHLPRRDFSSAVADLAVDRPVLLELWSLEGDRSFAPPLEGICVAAPFAPVAGSPWTVIESPKVVEYAAALVRWAALRLPRDGHFVPSLAEEWLEAAAARGAVDGLGAALGLLGVMDQYGVPELRRRGTDKMAARVVADRFAELRRSGALDAAWLSESSMDVLGSIAKRLLTESPTAWEEPRPLEAWLELVPPEYQGGLDAEWVRASLGRSKNPPTVNELERALVTLPPGPFRIVRGLEQAGLLRAKHGTELLGLAPRWLAVLLLSSARAKITRGTPGEWSEALLTAHASGPTAKALVARAVTGDLSVLEDALDATDARDPAAVAALEAAFRSAGLATLSGVEIPEDLVLALWDQQMALVVELDDGPYPRLGFADAVAESEPTLDLGVFRLAALALSESLPRQRGLPHPVLRPWPDPRHASALSSLNSIWNVVRRVDPQTTAWARGAYALATRLKAARDTSAGSTGRRTVRETPASERPHPLEWPHRVLSLFDEGKLEWGDVSRASPDSVTALFAIAAHERTDLRAVATAFWAAWARDPSPLHDESPLSPTGLHWRRFYSSAPAAALEVLFAKGFVTRERVPYALLDEAAWRGVIASRPDAVSGVPAAWASMPPSILREALRATTPTEDDLRGAWERAPEIVTGAVDDALDRDDPLAANLLAAAPSSRTAELVARLSHRLLGATWLRRTHALVTRRWLVERVARRSEGWRDAFELLSQLD